MVRVSVVCCAKSRGPVQRAHRRRFSRGKRHCIIPRFGWAARGVSSREDKEGKGVKPQQGETKTQSNRGFQGSDSIPDPFLRSAGAGNFVIRITTFCDELLPAQPSTSLDLNLTL